MPMRRGSSIAIATFALAGCATPEPLEGQRTVFNNPFARPVIDDTGIGPQCDIALGRDATCLGVPLTRRGRGNTIGPAQSAGLTRSQRRILRKRAELLKVLSEQGAIPAPPPPFPSIPPVAVEVQDPDETP